MNEYMRDLKVFWLAMVEPPWRHSSSGNMDERTQMIERGGHFVMWCVGWLWAVAGLVAGALVAPSLVQLVGLADSPYMDWLVIAVAVLAGFLLQVLSWVFIGSLLLRCRTGRLTAIERVECFTPPTQMS